MTYSSHLGGELVFEMGAGVEPMEETLEEIREHDQDHDEEPHEYDDD